MTSDNLPIIRKSNDLIDARYKLSVAEQRLILLLLSKISPSDKDFKDYEIRVADLAEMFNLELNGYLYEQLQNTAENLVGQRIRLRENKIVEVMAWFSYIRYEEGTGVVKLRFDKSLKPYLLQLKSHFTQYHLNHPVDFKSQYSIRLYELLKMDVFKAKNGQFERVFEIKELRLIFGIEKNEYPLFSNLRDRVIEPAMREVSKTDLNIIEVKYGKTGRKVTSITFVVMIRSVIPTQALEKPDNHPVIDALIALGFSPEVAKAAKTKHGIKRLERNIAYTLMKEKAGIAKDVPAYLKSAITEDWGAAWEAEQAKKATAEKQKTAAKLEVKATTEKATQDKKARYQKAFNDFLLLPENQQEELKQAFFEQSDLTISAKIKAAQSKGIDIFTSPLVASPFKVFLVERGF
ncbi:MAG: replication initiation protein [Methylococcaceae bacterium]|nr:replication initiation protein [Methylococcaceae bacterium]